MTCHDAMPALSFESMLSDPLIRLVMDADGVTVEELVSVMVVARDARPRPRHKLRAVPAGCA